MLATKHCKYRGFCYQEQKNIVNTVNTVVLGLRGVKKHGNYGVFCSETLQKTRKHHRIDDFWALNMNVFFALEMVVKNMQQQQQCEKTCVCVKVSVCKRVCL